MATLGVEMEMAVARCDDGASHAVGPFFDTLCRLKTARGLPAEISHVDGRSMAVDTPLVHSSVDNAFNNLESAIGPIPAGDGADGTSALHRLDALMRWELSTVLEALAAEGAFVVNASQHPDVRIDNVYYHGIRAPKPIYDYWVRHRGWDHSVGVDAKAQNGPTTGVQPGDAVKALNVVLAAAPAFIALTANSPLEAGRPTGLKETRLTIWPRMFANARFPADLSLQALPDRPFDSLRDYFTWMFGRDTRMQAVPVEMGQRDYKGQRTIAVPEGEPSLLEFLAAPRWSARRLDTGESTSLTPALGHLEYLQFCHFLDARIRFGLRPGIELAQFHEAWQRDGGLEELFSDWAAYTYIEGRAPGANFADAELWDTAGDVVAASITIAPSALQKGLLANLDAAWRELGRLDWTAVAALRQAAIRDGLDGRVDDLSLRTLCARVVELASDGLATDEQWMLAYPFYVLESGLGGADRTLARFERLGGDALGRLTIGKRALCPPAPSRPRVRSAASGGRGWC